MAGTKGMTLAFYLVLAAFQFASSETLNSQEDEELLQAMMSSAIQMDQGQSSPEKRGYRQDWKKHPLFPLYPIDFPVCKDSGREKKHGLCGSWQKYGFCKSHKGMMKRFCPETCGMCKAFAAPACSKWRFGCCWDNSKAPGPDGEGCPPCLDIFHKTCPQFKNYCSRSGKNALFVRYHCFDTCGRCALHNSPPIIVSSFGKK